MLNSTPALEACAADRLAGFPTFLRANGFAVGGGDAVQVLRTAERVGVLDPHVLRWSLQALLCGRGDEWRRFDELFDAWFLPANRWQKPERRDAPGGVMPGDRAADTSEAEAGADDDKPARPRHAASREAVLEFRRLSRTDRTRARAGHRSLDATSGAATQADPLASPRARPQRQAAGLAVDDPPQRGQRRHAVPPGVARPPPRASRAWCC